MPLLGRPKIAVIVNVDNEQALGKRLKVLEKVCLACRHADRPVKICPYYAALFSPPAWMAAMAF